MAKVTLHQLDQLLMDTAELLGKMDITAKRNFVFALLLLKRSSDAFAEAAERVRADELALGSTEEEARAAADDPELYTEHVFVPPEARWTSLAALTKMVGNKLNEALTALERHNMDLAGVLRHVDFNKAPGGERLTDGTLVQMIRLLSQVRLGDQDLEFPDLIGTAYESTLRRFADASGSGSGDLYTPRPIVRLMVGLADPAPGHSVYDPCAGSAGMLVLAREHVEDHYPGRGGEVALAGQELSASQYVDARMNLLLHGIRDADVLLGDTLAQPRHITGDRPRRFSRILSNPEFSAEYDDSAVAANAHGRFQYGSGTKAADLLFVQHMVASLDERDGLAVTVMPHGVLFRSGQEKKIRENLLRADVIEAVIGLAPGIFSGTGIPACLLLLRAPGAKPPGMAGTILFINADREFTPGRTQNQLGEEHLEKIIRVYRERRTVPGFSRLVPISALLADDANLNIRRWVDNTPSPEPQDVGAHLYGGVPRAEVDAAAPAFAAFGLDISDFFASLDADYSEFPREGPDAARERLAVCAAEAAAKLHATCDLWWRDHAKLLRELPSAEAPMKAREDLLESFRATLGHHPTLDEFALTGLVAEWWGDHLTDIKALAAGGPLRVVQGWVTSIEIMLAPQRLKGGKVRDRTAAERREARSHPLVGRVMPEYLDELDRLETAYQALDVRVRESLAEADTEDRTETGSAAELRRLKRERTAARRALDEYERSFERTLVAAVSEISRSRAEEIVLDILNEALRARLDARLDAACRDLVERYHTLARKYETSLEQLEAHRDQAARCLREHLRELGYPRRANLELF
ncbi:class I SAM-dependent DNA methyltransferase [Actinomadura fulvescens]|uniref:site-specific DNA-methyltransferase (adenine-specific) n=1 Tax=Actinomadura fulvescens TaxID=46160 RepID=A0ABN3PYE9_9ACTN